MIDTPSTRSTRDAIGVENSLFESDSPHGDGTGSDTQAGIEKLLGELSPRETRMLAHENAAALYPHPLPKVRLP